MHSIKLRVRHNLIAFLLSSIVCISTTPSAFAADEQAPLRIQGTFIQLLSSHGEWHKDRWEALFTQFKELGLSRLVVQWSLYEDLAFFQTSDYRSVSHPPLENILALADAAGIDVFVGLYHDPNYWKNIDQGTDLVKPYLQHIRYHSTVLAKSLTPLLKQHASFRGWYISEEIDDISWQMQEKRHVLFEHLHLLSEYLHKLTPNEQVAISGFSNAATDPETFEIFWSSLLQVAPIDIVLFQDGIGVNKLGFRELPFYLRAMNNAVVANARDLMVVIEIFSQTEGIPLDNNPFLAVPAPLERIEHQLQVSSEYSEKNIAFSIPEYMNRQGSPEAQLLYEHYRSHLSSMAP